MALHRPLTLACGSALAAALALGSGGCATGPSATSPPRGGSVAPRADGQATVNPLRAERQWLQAWFRDTPVRIAEPEGGVVSVEVPRQFSFEAGSSEPKPALLAVLDKVAESLRRVPTAQLVLIAAPDDGAIEFPRLAQERAGRVQRHLRSRGVAASRLARPGISGSSAVQLRLEALPPAL